MAAGSLDLLFSLRPPPDQSLSPLLLRIHGLSGQVFSVRVSRDTSVAELKWRIWDVSGIPAMHQRLIVARRQLEDDRTMADYNINDGAQLQLLLRQR